MTEASLGSDGRDTPFDVLWEEGERLYRRIWRAMEDGGRREFLVAQPRAEHPTPGMVSRLAHEYGLKDYLDHSWALRPLELVRERGQTVLVLEYHDGEPLDRLLGPPMEIGRFLRLAVALTNSLARLHERGLIHKDVKPGNVLVARAGDHVWLTGFGVATPLPLAAGFLHEFAGATTELTPEATEALRRHEWPGNVRELRNVLERALIMSDGPFIDAAHLGLRARKDVPPSSTTNLETIEKHAIARAMRDAEGNKVRAARRLGISRMQLYGRLRKFGLENA